VRGSLVLVVALLLLGAGCGGSDESDSSTNAARQAGLTDLQSVDDYAQSFAADGDHPRLVLLLAPT
jgi:hypothetical protein